MSPEPRPASPASRENGAAGQTAPAGGGPASDGAGSDRAGFGRAGSDRGPLSRRWFLVACLVIYLGHVGLVSLFCPWSVVLGPTPFAGQDYQTHYQQTYVTGEALRRFGRTWAYDPNMLAGFPAGLMFDVDNKAHGLFTYALDRLGLRPEVAFNLFAVLSCLLAPLSLLGAATLLGMGRGARLAVLVLGVLLWQFDSGPRFLWWVGMISFGTISHGCVLALGLFYRLVRGGGARFFIPLLVLMPLLHLVHVFAFMVLAVPFLALYLIHWRRLGLAGHLSVWSVAAATVLGNLYWFWPLLTHMKLMTRSAWLGQATPIYFLTDYLGIVLNPFHTGHILLYTFFRYAALCGAVLTLVSWRRSRDERFSPLVLTLGWLLGLAYLGSYVPLLRQTEPYRFVAPATMVAGLLAGPWFAEVLTCSFRRSLPRPVRPLIVVLLVMAAPGAIRDVLVYIPELHPRVFPGGTDPRGRRSAEQAVKGLSGQRPPPPHRLESIPPDLLGMVSLLRDHCKEEGRVLVQYWPVAEYLRWATDRAVIGGFPERRSIHEDANIFRLAEDPRLGGDRLARYLVRYNIRYVIMTGLYFPQLESQGRLVEPLKMIGLHRIYRVRHTANYFVSGSGKVRTGLNRIEVTAARPAPGTQQVILRFHHMDTLVCRPGCAVERFPLPDDRAGFIRVAGRPRLPGRFVIEHRY